jgi:Tfp pilus assembly protein PilO
MLIAGWELGISPTLTNISAANAQTTTIENTNAASRAQLANLQLQFKGISKFKKSLNKLRESIPENEGASDFLNEISALCGSTGVTLSSITLASATLYVDPTAVAAPPAAADTTTTPAPSAAPTTPAVTTPTVGNGLVLIPVVILVTGPFDAVRDFVDAAQQGTRLLYSASADISISSDGSTTATITGDIFALQGTSDASPKQKLAPIPTSTGTPTATPTPTNTTTTSSSKSGSNTSPSTAPSTTPSPAPSTDPPADPGTTP